MTDVCFKCCMKTLGSCRDNNPQFIYFFTHISLVFKLLFLMRLCNELHAYIHIYTDLSARGVQVFIRLSRVSLISSGFNYILHHLQLTRVRGGSPLQALLVQVQSKDQNYPRCSVRHMVKDFKHKSVQIHGNQQTLTRLSAAVSSSSSSGLVWSWNWMTDTLFRLVSVGQLSSTLLCSRFSNTTKTDHTKLGNVC